MLTFPLIHPEILAALAAAGHRSTVLLADANYAHSTGTNPAAALVHLNLRPGLVTVEQVLATLVEATPFEAAALMAPDDGSPAPWAERYGAMLGSGVPIALLARGEFKAACLSTDLALTIATGDDSHYSNVLLTIGAVPPTPR